MMVHHKQVMGVKLMDEWIRGKQIMIVDDDSDLTLFCKMSLEYYGFVVDTFNEPKEALSSFKPNYYDLVILDIRITSHSRSNTTEHHFLQT